MIAPKITGGNLNNLYFDIDEPIAFKEQDFEMKNLSLLTGLNGTGKSFVLVNSWTLYYLVAVYAESKKLPIPQSIIEVAQYIYDFSINSKNITGIIKGIFDNITIELTFEKGKIVDCVFEDPLNITDQIVPIYMSAHMRTFFALDAYARERAGFLAKFPYDQAITMLIGPHKLYDVLFMERMMMRLPLMITVEAKEKLKQFNFLDDVELIGCDSQGFYLTYINNEDKNYISKCYGSGEQSLLNMIISSQI